MSKLIRHQDVSSMIFSELFLESLFPPTDTELPRFRANIFYDISIVTLALCLTMVCFFCFSIYLAYLRRTETHDSRLLNVLYGNLAVNMQLLSLFFVSTIVLVVMDTDSVENNTISFLEEERIFVETNQALLLAQLTLATCARVWRPGLYLALSLKWRNAWTLLLNLVLVTGFLAWVGDATIEQITMILGSVILLSLLTQLVIMVKETGGWRKIKMWLLCWCPSSVRPGPNLVLPFVEEVATPQPTSQVTFIFTP